MYNQTSIKKSENLQGKHTEPNRRIPIQSERMKNSKGSTQYQTEEYPSKSWFELWQRSHKKNKINKSLAAVWHGTKIVRLYLDYYLLEIYNNYYKIILTLSTEQTKTRWNIPMKGMRTTHGPSTLPSKMKHSNERHVHNQWTIHSLVYQVWWTMNNPFRIQMIRTHFSILRGDQWARWASLW